MNEEIVTDVAERVIREHVETYDSMCRGCSPDPHNQYVTVVPFPCDAVKLARAYLDLVLTDD